MESKDKIAINDMRQKWLNKQYMVWQLPLQTSH